MTRRPRLLPHGWHVTSDSIAAQHRHAVERRRACAVEIGIADGRVERGRMVARATSTLISVCCGWPGGAVRESALSSVQPQLLSGDLIAKGAADARGVLLDELANLGDDFGMVLRDVVGFRGIVVQVVELRRIVLGWFTVP